jgi:hypothetical protein
MPVENIWLESDLKFRAGEAISQFGDRQLNPAGQTVVVRDDVGSAVFRSWTHSTVPSAVSVGRLGRAPPPMHPFRRLSPEVPGAGERCGIRP